VARHHTGTASQLVPSAGRAALGESSGGGNGGDTMGGCNAQKNKGHKPGRNASLGRRHRFKRARPAECHPVAVQTSLVYRRLSTRDSALPPPPLAGLLHQMRRRRSPTSEPLHTCGNGIRLRPSRVVCVVDQGRAVVAADRMPPSLAPVTGRHGGLQARAVSNT
jgi:hypothetical protein